MTYLLYIIYCMRGQRTYIGITNNLERRLRKHRGEIKGGAKFTTRYSRLGHAWVLGATVHGFHNHQEALRFEWAMQHPGRSKFLRSLPRLRAVHYSRNLRDVFHLTNCGDYAGHLAVSVHESPGVSEYTTGRFDANGKQRHQGKGVDQAGCQPPRRAVGPLPAQQLLTTTNIRSLFALRPSIVALRTAFLQSSMTDDDCTSAGLALL